MRLENKKIAIIGGGPGGLTLARLLEQKNINVKVYERDVDRNARVQGSPVDLHEHSGLAALREAGLLDEFRKNYMEGADKTTITNEQAEIVFSDAENKQEEAFGEEHFRPEIDRGVLRSILIDALDAACIVWNRQFVSMQKQGEGWLLNFKDGTNEYADIVIGSDGANSKIRPYLTHVQAFYSGITMLEGNIYDAEKKVPKISAMLRGGKIMAFGNQQNILMGQKSNGEIGFYASFKAEAHWAEKSGLDFSDKSEMLEWFKTAYSEWNEIWQELFEHAAMPYIVRPINCMPLNQSWAAMPNLTIIGDAAHLMPPFAGEGANMAMLDALELSQMLLSEEYNDIRHAIAHYETEMRERASSKAKESLENGERMHSENALSVMTSFFSGT
ncbi:FAD-dependent oxidoreductase [Pedobacter sp. GR22-10]|uniref:FAD-dependent oxidoreductase n=1 Tax=Pedobacter sp. GR22-10 TaxID=2994472 RepID=UPI0022480357|nr:NAD(P)/FAD-dependent oxidoreductase [Pedobacter sp. GR22-10]MCX2432215.1 NAD(P)/FAD-dependent oxidoreductase [Pedobacter sp. GR22-10]